jgi:glycosyltransferase involved in cell wall biosynthesis
MPFPPQQPVDLEILTVAIRPRIGGMTSWIEQIAAGLAKKGWKVRVVAFSDRVEKEGHGDYEVWHVQTPPVGRLPVPALDKYWRWKSAAKQYRNWRKEAPQPRLLLSDGTPGILKLARDTASAAKVPWAIVTGGNVFAEVEGTFLSSFLAQETRAAMNAADRIFVDGSDLVEALVSNGIKRDLLRIQYHGVDLSRFAVRGGAPRYFSEEGPQPRIRLVWHGRFTDYHGPLRFLEIAEEVEGAQARLCGGGEQQGDVKKVLARFEIPRPFQWVDVLPNEELGGFLSEADAGVYPLKDMTGIPTVLLESMAAGLPTLTYPVGAVSELIHHGENGFICRDKQEMIATLANLIDNPELRKRIGEAARATIENDWSEEATLNTLECHLKELLGS